MSQSQVPFHAQSPVAETVRPREQLEALIPAAVTSLLALVEHTASNARGIDNLIKRGTLSSLSDNELIGLLESLTLIKENADHVQVIHAEFNAALADVLRTPR